MNADYPIESCSDDALGRASVARRIADQLALAPMNHSIVFGLYGPWGSGKTSLLNMVCEKLESSKKSANYRQVQSLELPLIRESRHTLSGIAL